MTNSLYYAHLMAHYKNPANSEPILSFTFEKTVFNHLCGDRAYVRILLVNHRIMEVSIQAKGCVISVATASILSEYIKGKACIEFEKISARTISEIIGIPLGPVRLKCALLSFDGIVQGLQEYCDKR